MSRPGSGWAAQRCRTLLHVVANWIASGNAVDNSTALDSDGVVALVTGNGRPNSTVSVFENVAVSSLGGNGVDSVQETVGG